MPKDYLEVSRAARYSLSFALPLLLLYEAFSFLLTGSATLGVRNGADVLMKSLFLSIGGRHGLTFFGVALLGTGAFLVWRDMKRAGAPLQGRVFTWMLGESVLYALLFGFVVGWLTALVLGAPGLLNQGVAGLGLPTQLVTSLGAGIYEELLFRVLLTGGLLYALGKWLRWKRGWAVAVAVLASALIFSGFHYFGELGDDFALGSFTFRAIAGMVFSGMYVWRGLGITAWTHALYDVGLVLLRA
jgi:hypothetical protein